MPKRIEWIKYRNFASVFNDKEVLLDVDVAIDCYIICKMLFVFTILTVTIVIIIIEVNLISDVVNTFHILLNSI